MKPFFTLAHKYISMKSKTSFISDISKKEFPLVDRIAGKAIRNPILTLIQNEYPDFDEASFIHLRIEYVS
jgi:hypothetical protein